MAQLGLEPGTCIPGQALSPRATYCPSALCQALAEGSCDLLAGLNPSAVTMLPFHYLWGGEELCPFWLSLTLLLEEGTPAPQGDAVLAGGCCCSSGTWSSCLEPLTLFQAGMGAPWPHPLLGARAGA